MFRFSRLVQALLLILVLALPSLLAYDTDLSDTAVREAYFLGRRNDDKTRAFLEPYSRHLPLPKSGPYISEIHLLTPLARVVKVSSTSSGSYSAQQAQLDYRDRGDSLLLEVHIQFTPTYNQIDAVRPSRKGSDATGVVLRTEDFWKNFRFGIKQKEDWIESRSIYSEPEYSSTDSYGSAVLIGSWVYIEFDAHSLSSDDTEVHVVTPDGQDVVTSFDLDKLR